MLARTSRRIAGLGRVRAARALPPVRCMGGGGGDGRSLGEYWQEFQARTEGLPTSDFGRVAREMKSEYLEEHHEPAKEG